MALQAQRSAAADLRTAFRMLVNIRHFSCLNAVEINTISRSILPSSFKALLDIPCMLRLERMATKMTAKPVGFGYILLLLNFMAWPPHALNDFF
ncbi:hypothetical protein [Raoultella planticola]|uniref:hypothetical protein n=1 Tax=Raoultella planticola TaxID=575 RepID=UPI001C9D9913|nr:hypothetical protein [Raoultella planticola]QZS62489.1 hypothetical protein K6028_15745 [Raoultella planticola]